MLTRHGYALLVGAVAAVVIGRVFAVVELFIIAAACAGAAVLAVGYVQLRRPRVDASRWVHPSVIVAGETGRVDLHLRHRGQLRSARFDVCERVDRTMGGTRVARLPVAPMSPGQRSTTGYPLPSAVRGIIQLGPLEIELSDPLGLARSSRIVAGVDEVVVAPRVHPVDIPQLGQGILGNALLAKARRLGPGEFHGLREYADGDEPRSIHWKASARTDTLMVKEHTMEGLRRCTVMLDTSPGSYTSPESFERGVTAAASVVHSASHAGLTTRFATSGGVDLRGPDVSATTMRVLARIQPTPGASTPLDHETGEGLGLVVVITGGPESASWRAAKSVDPTLTALLVSTESHGQRLPHLVVTAHSDRDFIASWQRLTGRGRLDLVDT